MTVYDSLDAWRRRPAKKSPSPMVLSVTALVDRVGTSGERTYAPRYPAGVTVNVIVRVATDDGIASSDSSSRGSPSDFTVSVAWLLCHAFSVNRSNVTARQ